MDTSMPQQEETRLLLLPWTYDREDSHLANFMDVLHFLLNFYSSLWQNNTTDNRIRGLTRTLQEKWDRHSSIEEDGRNSDALLKQLAGIHHTRFVVGGHVQWVPQTSDVNKVDHLSLKMLLYDTVEKEWVLKREFPLKHFEPLHNQKTDFAPVDWALDKLLKTISSHLLTFMNAEDAPLYFKALHDFTLATPYAVLTQLSEVEKLPTASKRAERYSELIQEHPNDALLHLLAGRQLKLNRRYTEAIQALEKALASPVFPSTLHSQILNELGGCLALNGEREKAIRYWEKAFTLEPSNTLTYMNITHAYEAMGQDAKAEASLKAVLPYAPNDIRIHNGLARVYCAQGLWSKVLMQYHVQLLLDPSDPWCHNNVATSSLKENKIDRAKKHFAYAQELDPEGEAGQYATLILAGIEDEDKMTDLIS
jgi:tetratricopeptide (TPR) repeat protein